MAGVTNYPRAVDVFTNLPPGQDLLFQVTAVQITGLGDRYTHYATFSFETLKVTCGEGLEIENSDGQYHAQAMLFKESLGLPKGAPYSGTKVVAYIHVQRLPTDTEGLSLHFNFVPAAAVQHLFHDRLAVRYQVPNMKWNGISVIAPPPVNASGSSSASGTLGRGEGISPRRGEAPPVSRMRELSPPVDDESSVSPLIVEPAATMIGGVPLPPPPPLSAARRNDLPLPPPPVDDDDLLLRMDDDDDDILLRMDDI